MSDLAERILEVLTIAVEVTEELDPDALPEQEEE